MNERPTAPPDLRAWLDLAHDRHGAQPRAVADELLARAASLPDDADGAEAVRLAEHLWLGHLADAAGLAVFLDALAPDRPAQDAARCRARWALSQARGEAPAVDLPRPEQWRVLQNLVLMRVAQGHCDEAGTLLAAPEAEAGAHPEPAARQAYAASANNVALHLRLGARGDAGRDALMLQAAQGARRAWATAGTWLHAERAEYQLALCHAVLDQGDAALAHAQQCLAICEAEDADAAERFFAHEALLHAHRAQMAALLPAITDDGLRQWCAQTLDAVKPAASATA